MRSSFETEWKKMYSAKVLIVFTQTNDDTGKKRGNITSFSIHEDKKSICVNFHFSGELFIYFFIEFFFVFRGKKNQDFFFFFFINSETF